MKPSRKRRGRSANDGRSERASDIETAPPPQTCPWLGFTGAMFSCLLSGLVFWGSAVGGRVADAFPCAVAVVLAWGFVTLMGRFEARQQSLAVFATVSVSIALGVILARSARPETVAPSVRLINLLLYGFAPVAGFMLARLSKRLRGWSLTARSADPPSGDQPTLRSAGGRAAGLVAIWLLVVFAAYMVGGSQDRTGFRMISVPFDAASADQSLLGFSLIMDQRPMMAETIPAVEQVSWFSGGLRSDSNFRYLRAGYSFLAAQFSMLGSPRFALLAINVLCWLVCLFVVWQLSRQWYGSTTAASASVCIAAVGIGFAVHINDTTPHMLSFALYFLGVWMISRRQLAVVYQPWPVHLQMGLLLGLMSLAYNVAQMLLLVYLVVSIRKQRPLHLISATLITVLFRPTWQRILPGLGINVEDIESEYFSRAMEKWRETFESGFMNATGEIVAYCAEILTSLESPWLLLLGAVSLATIRDRNRLVLCFVAIASPVAACLVFAPVATARGYIVFGSSVILYVTVGALLARLIERGRWYRTATVVLLGILLPCQFVWVTAHYHNWLAPSKAFFLGWDQAAALLAERPMILNATGHEPLPEAFGGRASFSAGGAVHFPSTEPLPRQSLALSLLSRLPFVAAILLVLNASLRHRRRRRIVTACVSVWFLFSSLVAFAVTDEQPVVFDSMNAIHLAAGQSLTYEVDLSADVANEITRLLNTRPAAEVELFVAAPDGVNVKWSADDRPIVLTQERERLWQISQPQDQPSIAKFRSWQFVISNPGSAPVALGGWQRAGLRSRRVITGGPEESTLPNVEVRFRDRATGVLRLAVF